MAQQHFRFLRYGASTLLLTAALILLLPSTARLLTNVGFIGETRASSIQILQVVGATSCALLALAILFSRPIFRTLARLTERLAALPSRTYLTILVGAALVTRVAWVSLVPSVPYSDFAVYHGLACNVAEGREYVDDFSDPTTDDYGARARRAPGFPFMLAAVYAVTGCDANAGKALVLFMSVAVVVLSYAVNAQAFGERTGRVAGLLTAFYPTLVTYSGILGTELPFTAFLLISLYGAMQTATRPRWGWLLVSGFAMGVAALIRPNGLIVIGVIALYWLITSRRLLPTVACTAILASLAVAIILPWSLRNERVFGHFVLVSTNSGGVMWEGTQTSAGGGGTEGGRLLCTGLNELECDSHLRALALQNIASDPIGYARYGLTKLVLLFAFGYQGVSQSFDAVSEGYLVSRTTRSALIGIAQGYHMIVMVLALFGAGWSLAERRWSPAHSLFLLVVFAWAALHVFFHGESRYHTPMLPLIAGFAAMVLARPSAPLPAPERSGS